MSAPAMPEPIQTLTLDPVWGVGTITVDGHDHIVLRVTFPVHGTLTILLPTESAASMSVALAEATGRVGLAKH